MAFDKENRADSPMKRRPLRRRKKVCVFCGKENNQIDYKESKARGAYKCLELLCAIDRCNRKRQRSNLPGEQMYVERAKRWQIREGFQNKCRKIIVSVASVGEISADAEV